MVFTQSVASSFVLAWLLLNAGAPAKNTIDDPALKDRFLKEYPAASKRLLEKYSHVHGSGLEVAKRRIAGEFKTTKLIIDFQFDGEFQKRSSRRDPASEMDGTNYSRTWVVTPESQFMVDRQTKDGPPILKTYEAANADTVRRPMLTFENEYLHAPFFELSPFADILKEPGFKLGDVMAVERDGRNLVQVNYTREIFAGQAKFLSKGMALLSPQESWVIVEHDLRAGSGGRNLKIEYGASVDGVPTLKKVTMESKPRSQMFEFKDFQFGPTAHKEFTTEYLGLPDLKPPVAYRGNQTPIYFITAGVIAAIAAIFLGIYRFRQNLTGQASPKQGTTHETVTRL